MATMLTLQDLIEDDDLPLRTLLRILAQAAALLVLASFSRSSASTPPC
jgi:hypothetical protein